MNMEKLPNCIKCGSEYTYEDGDWYICPDCAHEWLKDSMIEESEEELIVKDAYGNILKDGDSVTVIKDIKVKGTSSAIKVGLKIKDIHLVEAVNGHNIDAKVKGFGPMMLKSELVKKSN
jgi:protein PhnA